MGLTLSMREDERFMAGAMEFTVSRVYRDKSLVIKDENGNLFEVVKDSSVEIATDVWVSASERAHSQLVRIVIEAPREIRIRRGGRGATGSKGTEQEGQG